VLRVPKQPFSACRTAPGAGLRPACSCPTQRPSTVPSRCARRVCTSLLRCLPLRRLAPVRKRTATEAQARLVLASPATQVATTPGALPVPAHPQASAHRRMHARCARLTPAWRLSLYPTLHLHHGRLSWTCARPPTRRGCRRRHCGGPRPGSSRRWRRGAAARPRRPRPFHALLRALAALLAQVRQHQSGPALGRGRLLLNGTCCVRHAMIGVPV